MSLADEALLEVCAQPAHHRELQGHLPLEGPIGPLGKPDLGHPAGSQEPNELGAALVLSGLPHLRAAWRSLIHDLSTDHGR